MPNSTPPSISATASTSGASHASGVKLTPQKSQISSISSGTPIVYTPSTTSEIFGTPTVSIASSLPTTSTSLDVVFSRLAINDQRKALRNLKSSMLCDALGCTPKEVASLIVAASNDELSATFCQLGVENKRRSLESVKRVALKEAFREESGEDCTSMRGSSYSVAPSEASTKTLASAFKKLSVADQVKALAAVQVEEVPNKGLRRGANRHGLDDISGIADQDETLLESKPDLAEWQELCRACGLGVEEIPSSITKCKEILKTKNVALSDLSNAIRDGTVAQTFPTLGQLRNEGEQISEEDVERAVSLQDRQNSGGDELAAKT